MQFKKWIKYFSDRPYFIVVLFFCVLTVYLFPVICFKYFPTVDGPAHLYNAKIISELWWGNTSLYEQFFKFNAEPVPNWTGHFISVIAGLVFPYWFVEKIIVLLITVGIPFSMWYLARSTGVVPGWKLFLTLPFIYSVIIYLGFFNYLLSVILFFFIIARIIRWDDDFNKRNFMELIMLSTILYFTHVLCFVFALMFVCIYTLLIQFRSETFIFNKSNIYRLLAFVPGILFAIWFYSSRSIEGFRNKTEQIPMESLLKMFTDGSVLSGLNGAIEDPYTIIFIRGIALLLIITIFYRWLTKSGIIKADIFLLLSLIFLVAYFFIPDGMAKGGFISIRMILMSFMFVTVWLMSTKLPLIISVFAALLAIYTGFSTWPYRMEVATSLNSDVNNYLVASSVIPEQSIVLPLNYSGNWLHLNISAYAGTERDIIILENYEALYKEFPLTWKAETAPGDRLGNFMQSRNPFITPDNYENITGKKLNGVIRWSYNQETTDSIAKETNKILVKKFKKNFRSGAGDVFYNPDPN